MTNALTKSPEFLIPPVMVPFVLTGLLIEKVQADLMSTFVCGLFDAVTFFLPHPPRGSPRPD